MPPFVFFCISPSCFRSFLLPSSSGYAVLLSPLPPLCGEENGSATGRQAGPGTGVWGVPSIQRLAGSGCVLVVVTPDNDCFYYYLQNMKFVLEGKKNIQPKRVESVEGNFNCVYYCIRKAWFHVMRYGFYSQRLASFLHHAEVTWN